MEIGSYFGRSGERVKSDETIEIESSDVRLQLTIQSRYKATGAVTGRKYIWQEAGSIVSVDKYDSTSLLEKRRSGSCCGGSTNSKPVFRVVDE